MAEKTTRRRRVAHHWQILIGMAIGATAGLIARSVYAPGADGKPAPQLDFLVKNVAEPLGQIFLRLIFMVVIPLVFCALTLAVAELGDLRKLGRLGLRTLFFTLILSSASVAIGLFAANVIRPGERLSDAKRQELRDRFASQPVAAVEQAKKAKTLRDTLLDILPRKPLQEMGFPALVSREGRLAAGPAHRFPRGPTGSSCRRT